MSYTGQPARILDVAKEVDNSKTPQPCPNERGEDSNRRPEPDMNGAQAQARTWHRFRALGLTPDR